MKLLGTPRSVPGAAGGRTSSPAGQLAAVVTGYRDADGTHGDGYFIFKNSWDVVWGYGRPDPGFGSLPYRYVIKEAIEAFTVRG